MENFIRAIVENPETHAKWLNTLSMMENAGAKKIKNCEHPILVNELFLKHAAEEARHAFYLKKQIRKLAKDACPTYEMKYLLAPKFSFFYLHTLDVNICRYLKSEFNFKGYDLKYAAYLLVTFAIEVRADELYPVYQTVLDEIQSPVNVKSIIAEEMNHLEEMKSQLKEFSSNHQSLSDFAINQEKILYTDWLKELNKTLTLKLA